MKKLFRATIGRILLYLVVIGPLICVCCGSFLVAGAALGTFLVYSRNLPPIPAQDYQPRTVSTFYAADGTVIGVFYREKRYVVEASQIPPHVINAFLAAEDARFREHHGVDWMRILGAFLRNVKAGRVSQGGSTITMQVTRNFLLTRERRFSRKIKEMILAGHLDKAWGKEKILHVYLNEIYLGETAYGVEAAARTYFNKPVEHLSISEAALLAGLVAGPARFNPFKSEELARQKQLAVLGRMLKGGFITKAQYEEAKNARLEYRREVVRPFDLTPDFSETVRRYVIKTYGEEALLNEGLKVFTTVKVDMQQKAVSALQKGVQEIKTRQKHVAILQSVPKEQIPEILAKRTSPELAEGKLYTGVVTKAVKKQKEMLLDVALSPDLVGRIVLDEPDGRIYRVGHVLAVRFSHNADGIHFFVLDTDPKLEGAVVCIENKTGYVRAMVGGVSSERFKFNRAVQAKRQPGSAFKPLIYATALEKKSYTPATMVVDNWIVVDVNSEEVEWEPKNSSRSYMGPLTLRRALELSRNICTIKILMDTDLDPVLETARRMGISSELGRNLSLSLGASELTLYELTSAYTAFPNSGQWVEPTLVTRVEDRFGNVLENNEEIPVMSEAEIAKPEPREDFRNRFAELSKNRKASAQSKQKQTEPEPSSGKTASARVRSALSPQTAYTMTSLLQGVVRQGTASRMANYIKRKDLAGKTGTTNQAADAWFIGFNPEFTTGVWIGYDEKRPLGNQEEGARAALPVWGYFMRSVLEGKPEREFPMPPDISMHDFQVFQGNPDAGFSVKPVTEPVYTPFFGLTLALCPVDPPEDFTDYKGITLSALEALTGTESAKASGRTTAPAHQPSPLNPMDGRNLFPDSRAPAPRPAQAVSPPVSLKDQATGMSYRPPETSSQVKPVNAPPPKADSGTRSVTKPVDPLSTGRASTPIPVAQKPALGNQTRPQNATKDAQKERSSPKPKKARTEGRESDSAKKLPKP